MSPADHPLPLPNTHTYAPVPLLWRPLPPAAGEAVTPVLTLLLVWAGLHLALEEGDDLEKILGHAAKQDPQQFAPPAGAPPPLSLSQQAVDAVQVPHGFLSFISGEFSRDKGWEGIGGGGGGGGGQKGVWGNQQCG
jgi:hypothetical protein